MKYLYIGLLSILFLSNIRSYANTLCQDITSKKEFEELFAVNEKKAKKIYFFASWCLACKDYLQNLKEKEVILVAYNDSLENAEKIVKYFDLKQSCFVDSKDLISTKYKVTEIPKLIILEEL